MALNLRQIEVFRAVMTTGSISGASQLLFVSQPAVSRLLSHTEQRVGFALFERIKGRLYATPEAKKLFHEVEYVYQAVQRVNELATDLSENRSGILNIVSSPSIGQMLIPQAIALFRNRHPEVKLTFHCLNYGYLKDRLLSRQADLGIIILPMEHPSLQVTPLCSNRLVCVLPYNHELTRRGTLSLADLRPFPLISYNRDSPFGGIVGRFYQTEEEPLRPIMEVGSPQNACSLVQMGAGVALVDEFSVRSWAGTSQMVVRPVARAPILRANLVHVRTEPLSQLTQAFIAELQQLVRAQGYGLPDEETNISAGTGD
ncbi:LysR substrate-binding domain-containing protein [Herbaspirillum sp. WGmk3]|uniref:LysR substrate-binding domain-containing protein n=1 Tax=Herbaspirillum sp. WGmk3 TaxID=2919925 RepID=UPI002090D7A8|nr:LysR substrate-binding domain-containing protein [Herbaspirillum sp. WGmk3]MCO4858187.1 LysR substrate-binding domain-containing protein [Herbaspirillum sp. WGmk3]